MAATEKEWLQSQGYLPKFMRDFHAQKAIFKWIWRHSEKSRPDAMDWIKSHVYTIDCFLWFMARHGWALQRARTSFPTADWDATLEQESQEEAEAFRKMLDEHKEQSACPQSA